MASDARIKAYERGLLAETLCVILLRLKGFRILLRRYKTNVGEVDIVAKRGRHLHFIEVKARTREADCLHAVSPMQQQRIARAAEKFLAGASHLSALDVHFDLMYLLPGGLPRHIKDAWRM